jgi:hypothetical protein
MAPFGTTFAPHKHQKNAFKVPKTKKKPFIHKQSPAIAAIFKKNKLVVF